MTDKPIRFPLFLPADRMDRLEKAFASGADAVILDLEDGVAPAARTGARSAIRLACEPGAAAQPRAIPIWLRINAVGSDDHASDLRLLSLAGLRGVVLPKAETVQDLHAVRSAIGPDRVLIALVETARGLAAARDLACACDQLAFGSIDYAADLGLAHDRLALLSARSELVLAARLARQHAPLDGVSVAINDAALVEDDARHGAMMGFGGKFIIHPAQIAPAKRGFAPTATELAWAHRILGMSESPQAVAVAGEMVDAPVLARARAIVALAKEHKANLK